MSQPTVRHVQGSDLSVSISFTDDVVATWTLELASAQYKATTFALTRPAANGPTIILAELAFEGDGYKVKQLHNLTLADASNYWRAGRDYLAASQYRAFARMLLGGDDQLALIS